MRKSILVVAGIAILAVTTWLIVEKYNNRVANTIPLVTLVPQVDPNACWAASVAMVYNTINKRESLECDTLQCAIITASNPNSSKDKICDCQKCFTSSPLDINKLKNILNKYISGYKIDTSTMFLNYIKTLISKQKPIMYEFRYGESETTEHITVISGVETQQNQNSSISFLKITDPIPVCKGNEYYTTYERYYYQPGFNRSSELNSKYTIYPRLPFYDKQHKKEDSIYTVNYIKNALNNISETTLVSSFLENIKSNKTLTDDFFNIITLPSDLKAISVGKSYKIKNVGSDKITLNDDNITLEYLRNLQFNAKLVCLNKNKTIKTTITVSDIGKDNVSKWIIYSIEKGDYLDKFIKKQNNFIDENEDFILYLNDRGAYFMIFEDKDKITKVYDLYGNGFQLIGSKARDTLNFKDFLTNLKNKPNK